MIRIAHKQWILAATILMYTVPVKSQQTGDSLLHYLEIAADNNPVLHQKFAEYQAALKKVPQAGALSDPGFSAGVLPVPMELLGGRQVAELQVMQMFPRFGTLKAAKEEMSLMARAQYESYLDARLQLFHDIRQTWYDMYGLRQTIAISEKNLELLRSLEQLSLLSYQHPSFQGSGMTAAEKTNSPGNRQNTPTNSQGMVMTGSTMQTSTPSMPEEQMRPSSSAGSTLAELYQIQIDMEEIKNSIALSADRLITLTARFNSYLNRPAANPVALPDTLSAALHDFQPYSSDSLTAANPMLNMLLYEQQSLGSRETMAERMGYPMMAIGLSYSVISRNEMSASHMNGKDMVMPMVSFTLPVYNKKYKALREEAALLQSAAEFNYEASANNLIVEYRQAAQDYRNASRKVSFYSSQLSLASTTLDLAIRNLQVAGAGLADVLRAQRQVLDYELKKVDAIVALHTSASWLQRLESIQPVQLNNK